MLSKEETDFIRYWEQNRLRRKKIVRQFLLGIPIGLLFVIPILINFTTHWYKKADVEANSQDFDPRVLFVALLLIVAFTSVFYQRHKWDQYEQRYRELLARQSREAQDPANAPAPDPANSLPPDSANSPAPDSTLVANSPSPATGSPPTPAEKE